MSFVAREWQRLSKSTLARNAGWMMAGQFFGYILQAIYFVLLARLLGVTQYGVFVGAFAFVNLVGRYSTLGTGTVFLRYVSVDRSQFSLYWANLLVVTTLGGIGMVALMQFVGVRLLNPASAAIVLFSALSNCFGQQILGCVAQVFQAMERMRITAVMNLMMNFLRTLAAGLMLLFLHQASARQWAYASTGVSILGAVLAVSYVQFAFYGPKFSFQLLRQRMIEGIEFAFASSTTSAYNDLDKAMLSHYGMNAANGIYSLAYRVVDIVTMPIVTLRDAAMPQMFRKGKEGLDVAATFAVQLWKRTILVALVGAAAMFLLAPLVPRFTGGGFAEGVDALRWLCLIPVFRTFHEISGSALTGAGLQRYRTGTQVMALTLNVLLNLWLIPAYSWHGAAWSSLATDCALGILNCSILQILVVRRTSQSRTPSLRRPTRAAAHPIVRLQQYCASVFFGSWLSLRNRFWTGRCTRPGGPVVCLATSGKRIQFAHLTIESIARGTRLPTRLILWLHDERTFRNLPPPIRRLQKRGLEVCLTRNWGPHTRYYPYLESQREFTLPLVTAADDILYPRYWLRRLSAAYRKTPNRIHCYRASHFALRADGLAPSHSWQLSRTMQPSLFNFALSVSGVIYPPRMQLILKAAGPAFQVCCPQSDEIWLHLQALRANFPVQQIIRNAEHFLFSPETQRLLLLKRISSPMDAEYDRQASMTYTQDDLDILRRAAGRIPAKAADAD